MFKKIKENKKSIFIYLGSFFLPVLLMLIIYAIIGIYPFGKLSLLTIDLYHQYIDFLGYLRGFLMGDGSALYSFTKALGGNMIGLFAYYLTSPLNIVLVFFPKHMFSEAIMVLSLLKIGFCGVTFTVLLRHVFPDQRKVTTLIFSTCYALMAYNLVFQQNIMWLDGVIWLPIVILGIWRLVTKGKFLLYAVSLGIALFSNYYIGYMLCIFSLLFFIYQMYLSGARDKLFQKPADVFIRIGKFVGASLIAAALASIILIPTFLALQTGKASFVASRFTLTENFDFVQLLQKFFIGEMDIHLLHRGITTTLPDIFCGTLMLFLAALYFCNKKITYKEKAASGLFLAIMLLSFNIKAFDLIWHGFNTPIGFLYRNTFLFCFLMVYFAYRCFIHIDGVSVGSIFGVSFGYICLGIFISNFALDTLTASDIWLSIGVFCVYGLFLFVYKKPSSMKSIWTTLLLIFLSFEIVLSGVLMLNELSYTNRNQFVQDVKPLAQTVEAVKDMDDGFYRMDKNFERSRNDAAMQNYFAISHSSSTADKHVVDILNKLGFRDDSNIGNIYDEGSTLPANALLDIKYIMSRTNTGMPYYTQLNLNTPIYVFENPYALSLGMASAQNITTLSPKLDNPFLLQNQIYSSLTNGQVNQVLKPLQSQMTTSNLIATQNGTLTMYTKEDANKSGYIEFTMKAINNEEVYAFFPTEPISNSTCNIYVNGVNTRTYFDSDHLTAYDIINLGKFQQGQEIKVRIELLKERVDFSEGLFYALDYENFQKAYNNISQNQMNITSYTNSSIKAEVTMPSNKPVLFTTIPTDKGWSITIDGKPAGDAQLSSLDNTFIALQLTPGQHTIEFRYMPPGLMPGILISVVSLLALLAYVCIVQIRKHIAKKKVELQEDKPSILNDL